MNGNFDAIARNIESTIRERAEVAMKRSLEELKKKIDEYTPEDTYNLIKNNQIREGKWSGDRLVGKVENSSQYAVYVEYWRTRTGRANNYYKGGGRRRWGKPFYRGVGARMYARTKDELREKIVKNFEGLGRVSIR